MRIKFTVKKEDRIDKVISCETEFSRSKITELIENNKCFVNGETENKKSLIVKSKSLIEIIIPDEIKEKKYMKIKYHFIDEDILVVDKPKNLITHKAGKNSQLSLIENILIDYPEIKSVGEIDRPGIVHRLDKDTTGLMIIARSEIGYEKLKPMIKNREVSRNYTALVYGKPNLEEAIIDAPISRDPKNPIKRKVLMGGKKSKTSYKTIDRFSDFSLLDVKLFSGRTHQIRVHLDHIGHSIVGDKLYGGKNSTLDRPFLHSSRLEFKHPISKDELIFNSELPKDLKGFLRDI
ncbi:MAG: RluA family pseudouridine synthase [Chloroflexota bacterium]|nr:RluA family pseudouridine synthase [Chloroflexota bacterium]